MNTSRISNFSAGPAALPLSVLERVKAELLDYKSTGMSVMEMSHRSKEFMEISQGAEKEIRDLLNIPDTYSVVFLQGGASLQFSMVPLNLVTSSEQTVDLIQSGVWSQKAGKEIEKHAKVNIAGSTEDVNFMKLPLLNNLKLTQNAAFVHITSNNTIYGTQFKEFPNTTNIPLVADMSSDILSRNFDVTKFGLIYAGAQKNLGPSGVTLVIIRNDLLEKAPKSLPTMLQYRTHVKEASLYNTPPSFGIYIMWLVTQWIRESGGLNAMEKRNQEKADILYKAIDESNYFMCPILENKDRSFMNVVFRIKGAESDPEKEKLEDKFVKDALQKGISGIKGHRSAGGLRASIYNAVTKEDVLKLTNFMAEFKANN